MDRIFKESDIEEICDDIKDIIKDTKKHMRTMKNRAKTAKTAESTVPSDVRSGDVGGAAESVSGLAEDAEFSVIEAKLKSCKTRTDQIIKEDESYAKETDALTKQIRSAKGVLGEMKGFMTNIPLTTRYDDFMDMMDIAANRWNGKLRDIKQEVDKIRKNTKGAEKRSTEFSKDPVNLSTGNFIYDRTDLEVGGEHAFVFRRFYNAINDRCGVLGRDWNHNYEVVLETSGSEKVLILEEGKEERFLKTASGNYVSLYHSNGGLTELEAGFCYRTREQEEYRFDAQGRLLETQTLAGIRTILRYEETVLPETQSTEQHSPEKRLVRVERSTGEFFVLSYSDKGYLQRVTDHTGRSVSYEMSGELLKSATTPKGNRYIYRYNASDKLISVTNPRDIMLVENRYDEQQRTVHQKFPDGGSMSYEYDDEQNAVILTERNGSKVTYIHDEQFRDIKHIYSNGEERFTYNQMNQKTLVVDKLGNKTQYGYDEKGNVTRIINALGHKTELQYQEHNQPTYLAVNGQQKIKNRYNEHGDLIESVDALGNRYGIRYQKPGQVETIQQPDGSEIQLTYDERGNIILLRDAAGNSTRYRYDALNRVIESTDGNGSRTAYEYDEENNITKVINAAGEIRTYRYNESNKVTEIKDFNGSCIRREYNALNRPARIIDQEGRETLLTYDAMWNLARITEPNGAKTTFIYNEYNYLGRVRRANGEAVRYTYDAKGNLVKEVDEEGAEIHYAYDALDQLIEVTDPEGAKTAYEYDAEGNLSRVKDSLGNEAVFTYDALGNLIHEQGPCGEQRSYTYTPLGAVASVTDEGGRKTVYQYEAGDVLRAVQYPDGTTESYTYDGSGNIRTYTDMRGYTLTYTYDSLNQVIKITGSEGEEKHYTYDSVGNVTSVTDSLGNTTRYAYTLTGKLKQVTDALGNETLYSYDVCDRLIGVEQSGQATRYERDLSGRITAVTDALGQTEAYRYGKRGELLEKIDKEGYLTRYGYTARGEVKRIQYADGKEVKLAYNPLRHLQEVEDWLGITRITTDPLGRATKVQYPDGKEVGYQYGAGGERRSLTYPDGRTVSYGYDAQLRLKELRDGDQVITYGYSETGDLAEKVFPGGTRTDYRYNRKGQLTSLVHQDQEGILDAYYYDYDVLGNKQEVAKHRRGLTEENGIYHYDYDPIGRLQRVEKDGRLLSAYRYDAFGNRTAREQGGKEHKTSTYAYNAMNQLIKVVDKDIEIVYNYDKRGNLSEIKKNNELQHRYVYGALNRLEEAGNKHGETARYQYNGLGHRVGKEVHTALPTEKIDYTIDLTREYHNLLQKMEAGSQQTYLWDGKAASVHTELAEGGTRQDYYLQDDLGSPIRLVGETGDIRAAYGYDEFGEELYSGQGKIQPFGYTGYQRDDVAGTYYAQAREYRPEVGRFDGRDLIKGFQEYPFTLNEYVYCWNQPIDLVDLDGRQPRNSDELGGKSGAYSDAFYGEVKGPSIDFGIAEEFGITKEFGKNKSKNKEKKDEIGVNIISASGGLGKVGYVDGEGRWQGEYGMDILHGEIDAGITNKYVGANAKASCITVWGKTRVIEAFGKKIYIGSNVDLLSVGVRAEIDIAQGRYGAGMSFGVGVGVDILIEDSEAVENVETVKNCIE